MELKVLGSVSPYCKGEENGVSYLVTSNKSNAKIVLDLGYGSSRMFNFPCDLKNMHVILSHLHGDHVADLSAICYAAQVYHLHGLLDEKLTIYVPKGYEDEYYFTIKTLYDEGWFEIVYYDENDSLNIDGMNVTFQKSKHPVPAYSARITDSEKTIVYTGDCGYDEELIPFYNDADILLHDSGFLRENKVNDNHSTAFEAGVDAKKANVKKLVLTHFWPEIDSWEYVEEAKEVFENTFAARTGKSFEA